MTGARWCVAVVVVGVMVGCAPGGDGDVEQTPESSPQPSPSPEPEELALEAYEGMWDVVVEQSRTTDPDYSALERYAEGEALELAEHGLGAEAEEGVVARGEPSFAPEASAQGDVVEIEDCVDSTAWQREDAESGELLEDEPEEPITRRMEATVSSDGLAWRVSDLRIWEAGSC